MKAGYDLERELLNAAGITDEETIKEYKSKLELIDAQFHEYMNEKNLRLCSDELVIAKALHRYLFDSKPRRAVSTNGKDNRVPYVALNRVIDAQLGSGMGVGNCCGLTALYSALGIRNGLKLSVMASPTHVSSRLDYEGNKVDIENTHRKGFGRKALPSARECGLGMLVSAAHMARGVQDINDGALNRGISALDMAIKADNGNYLAFFNRGKAKEKAGNLLGAIADYKAALKINPAYEKAANAEKSLQKKLGEKFEGIADDTVLNEGGNIKLAKGNIFGAISDYKRAMKMNPLNEDARNNLETASEMLSERYSAITDEPEKSGEAGLGISAGAYANERRIAYL